MMCFSAFSQGNADPNIANFMYKRHDYEGAIKQYKQLLKISPNDKQFNKNLGLCYLESDIAPKKSLTYLKKAYELYNSNATLAFYIGKSLMFHEDYAEASKYFHEYLNTKQFKYRKEGELLLQSCETAISLKESPINVEVTNLGDSINTKYPEFYPYLFEDSLLIFSGRIPKRGTSTEFDGLYQSDVYSINILNSKYPTPIKKLNSSLDEQVCGIHNTDVYVYFDHIVEYGDIEKYKRDEKYGFKQDRDFVELTDKKAIETSVFFNKDGSKMYYTSNSSEGIGEYDIFMKTKVSENVWSEAISLNINTTFDEGFPFLSEDEKTLYFCSNGLPGMGGFDLFKSTWNESLQKWNTPINLGYPLNTPSDEKFIWFINSNEAYISGFREDGFGYEDLYKVTFK